MNRKRIKKNAAVLMVLAFLPALAGGAQARVKKIKAKNFQEVSSSSNFEREPAFVGAPDTAGGSVIFTAALKLPVGAEVTGVDYWRSSGAGTETVLTLAKITRGEPGPPAKLIEGSSTAATTSAFEPHKAGTSQEPGADMIIRKNSLYFLLIQCSAGSYVWQVDVEYTP